MTRIIKNKKLFKIYIYTSWNLHFKKLTNCMSELTLFSSFPSPGLSCPSAQAALLAFWPQEHTRPEAAALVPTPPFTCPDHVLPLPTLVPAKPLPLCLRCNSVVNSAPCQTTPHTEQTGRPETATGFAGKTWGVHWIEAPGGWLGLGFGSFMMRTESRVSKIC